ncbi:MAG: polysaccharide deacetylase family protein [Bacteroidota bacterium]|nr:polysaccharide deacetylase family protein [Bacteroidota bacterium]
MFLIALAWVASLVKSIPEIPKQTTLTQVPILCYHNIKNSRSGYRNEYTLNSEAFREQIKMLHDSGYSGISPDQLLALFIRGARLPKQPILISFDDTHEEHFSIAAPILERYGYRGVFFIMTVAIGKPGYMTAAEIKALSDRGHIIACHTWDHPDVRKLNENQWHFQLDNSRSRLEQITGRPVKYFAYPSGQWNNEAISQLKKRGILAAFQLMGARSKTDVLYSMRRLMVSGNWSANDLQRKIQTSFR